MGYIYLWRKVTDTGKKRFKGRHNGFVVHKVFKVEIPFYDKTDSEWKRFVKEKIEFAKDKGMIDRVEGKYDVRTKCWTRPVWKGEID